MVAATVGLLAAAAPASAANFEPGPGTYTVDTTALTITGPGTSISGVDQGGIAVFSFDKVSIPLSVSLEVEGSRPFKLVSAGELALAGVIFAGGTSSENFNDPDFVPGPLPGGPGGGAGSADGTSAGQGPGAGGNASVITSGGGGGGFGGVGAAGGASGGSGGTGGTTYGDLNAVLQGGSGGSGASAATPGQRVGGGGGGGAVALFGSSVRITSNGAVLVEGGGGAVGNNGASGGGSGGGILIHGNTVQMDGILLAGGGDGGKGGCCGAGGGGGGGRIALQYQSLSFTGFTDVSGGTSGARQSQGSFGTGILGDPAGAEGVVTKVQGPSAVTAPASAITSKGATLNGTVTPSTGAATTYVFEYGTTTAYGAKVPVPNGPVGASTQAVSQAISGLAPNTTYHFRLVASGLGFTPAGADVSFKTPACIVPKLKGKKVKAAKKALKKAGCKTGKVKKSFSGKVAKGRVIKQRTKPGKVLPSGAKVGLKVSKGEKEEG
jgi:hypothetical protein